MRNFMRDYFQLAKINVHINDSSSAFFLYLSLSLCKADILFIYADAFPESRVHTAFML